MHTDLGALFFPVQAAADIRLLVLDVDGVLTDGGLYYDLQNQVMKRFDVQDGLGIKIAQKAGINIAVITGLESPAVEARMRDLGIHDYFAGFLDKRACLEELKERHNLQWEQMAYMGDDWVDLSVMDMVGLPLAVANAQPEVKSIASYVTTAKGGQGAVREIIRHLLMAQGKYDAVLTAWSHPC
ncbi:HAD-IIIA family hydrolase [Desulfovibrio sp. OttesenSCG-928-F20]|nr:HAD-IIIA family hydrolase [Desulfovibrio sp. OttesenSCG-928-M16]MDL2290600.1 HAD-IIIA family hydrolase [Desulfovibrio sp. OttesenSCG-928-F20]